MTSGATANFGRGDGDPLGGPDAPGAGQPMVPDLIAARVEFRVRRDFGDQIVVCAWPDPSGEAEELLLRLWHLWHGGNLARLQRDGTGPIEMT